MKNPIIIHHSGDQKDTVGTSLAKAIDYQMAGAYGSKEINKPTTYRGKGRPRKSDYALLEHPFDRKITKVLNKFLYYEGR